MDCPNFFFMLNRAILLVIRRLALERVNMGKDKDQDKDKGKKKDEKSDKGKDKKDKKDKKKK